MPLSLTAWLVMKWKDQLGKNSDNLGSLSTVVGDEKLTSWEDRIGPLFMYVQSDEDTFLKVNEVSKTESQAFDVFDQLVSRFKFCIWIVRF